MQIPEMTELETRELFACIDCDRSGVVSLEKWMTEFQDINAALTMNTLQTIKDKKK